MIRESAAKSGSGMFMLLLIPALILLCIWWLVGAAHAGSLPQVLGAVFAIVVLAISLGGFFVVEPNQATVLLLFGNYQGSERRPGLWWANPFMTKKRVTMRVRNFESSKLKVNDHDGNPIEIAAVIVWQVVDSAEAMFQVDNYQQFVSVQSESAVRNLATSHPYDAHEEGQLSLRQSSQEIADALRGEIQARLEKAGVQVLEARISHLAYAPEIASAMLRRQQASAVIAARTKIVQGAVGMVEMALEELSRKEVVHLDEERKAAMVSNMLVVLCSEQNTQPVVNTGTLYH
jgi:regulator of protease activity HflC (stomatin/prohibitin superfamily)